MYELLLTGSGGSPGDLFWRRWAGLVAARLGLELEEATIRRGLLRRRCRVLRFKGPSVLIAQVEVCYYSSKALAQERGLGA